tara:strand:- start:793 stop:1401 length:609 start_codon:yes stop_codon:yes gene_type:complete
MSAVWSTLLEQARAWSLWEIVAVILAVAYLLLAIRQNIWCWLCAGLSTAIYVYLFVDARLYMESALNVFYFAMAVYGWYVWRYSSDDGAELTVTVWPLQTHVIAVAIITAVAGLNGYLLASYTDAEFPYLDSLTTWAAIWATFLIARKVLENWAYLLVIDFVSIGIYWVRGLELTALLFVLYVIMIPFGFLSWRRSMRLSNS